MTYSPRGQPLAHAVDILLLIQGGMTVAAACSSDPAFPSLNSFVKYCRRDPARAARLQAAFRQRQLTATDKASPRLRRVFTDQEYASAIEVIASTITPLKFTLEPPLPTYQAIWQRADVDPAFGKMLRAAMAARKRLKAELARIEAAKEKVARLQRVVARKKAAAKPVFATDVLASTLRLNKFYAAADQAVPKHLDPWDRDDIKSDLVVAMIEGTLSPEEATRSGKEFARQFMSRSSRYLTTSLDFRIYGDGETMIDQLSADATWVAA